MKSLKQLRNEIQTLRAGVEAIREMLLEKVRDTREPTWGIGRDCAKTAEALGAILKSQVVPEWYKVAVVGRFKAGKSAFVNELLGARLAGEDTNPETAAVTTFYHGPTTKATIHFVSAEAWENRRQLYQEDAKHIDAHRIKMWESFNGKARKNSEGEVIETFDLSSLEKTYIKPRGHSFEILLENPGDRTSENAFRRRLKEFTSSTRPHHCLVTGIEITTPSPLLDEGVRLVDTPGLDDTERFRVTLTEKSVEDVDAVLFLTQSGVAYGQSEKDFMLTLLRRGTVKQLIFVITQVDKTYDQHLSAAEDNDEDPEPIAHRIQREERRIRAEIDATLNELGSEDSPALRRYREQLGVVGLVFTSARKHRAWKDGKKVYHHIHPDDPGGIERMKSQLLKLLSTESRLALVAHNIASGTKSALDDLLLVMANRRAALRDIKDGEVAEQRLANFRQNFESAREKFQSATETDLTLLSDNLTEANKRNALLIETIGLLAERELVEFETQDIGKHWKTRRTGYWGYMHDLQGRVANRIFPRVQQMLSDMTDYFAIFVDHFEKQLNALSASSEENAEKLDLGATIPFDLTKNLAVSLEKSLAAANDLIADQEQSIVSFLDDFVTDEVSDKISKAREKVSDIFGRGTTYNQTEEVKLFYAEVKRLLDGALTTHLRERSKAFGQFLVSEARGVPRNALTEVDTTLTSAEQNIKAAAMVKIGGERNAFMRQSDALTKELDNVIALCTPFLEPPVEPEEPEEPEPLIPITTGTTYLSHTSRTSESPSCEWIEKIKLAATTSVERFILRNGDTGWSFNRIFPAHLLTGCLRIALIDPYLAKHHQLRNLKEFLLVIAEVAKPKEILVFTSGTWINGNSTTSSMVRQVCEDLFRNFGTNLTVEVDLSVHDRYVVCDHGILFKMGRGLDIYKPATGLASYRPGNRRVRQTEIDVFAVDEWVEQHQQ